MMNVIDTSIEASPLFPPSSLFLMEESSLIIIIVHRHHRWFIIPSFIIVYRGDSLVSLLEMRNTSETGTGHLER